MHKLDSIKKHLSEVAAILNEFKSETVQMRILDLLLSEESTGDENEGQDKEPSSASRKPKTKRAKGTALAEGKRKKAPSGSGAPATLTQLLSGTFFDKARSINDIIEHCKHNLARTFKANEFSGKLGRMVRAGELTRQKNADMQYEYKKP